MKRILFSIILLFGLCSVFAAEPMSEISFDKTTHSFGKISQKNPVVTCTFTYKNTGDAPLVVNQVVTTCGCTVASYTETAVEPGKTGTIKITYDGKNRYSGKFKKIITVRSNAKTRLVRLYIEGEMTEEEGKK